jgi:hypothetical protein
VVAPARARGIVGVLDSLTHLVLQRPAGSLQRSNWSGRWESNPHGQRLQGFKTSGLAR